MLTFLKKTKKDLLPTLKKTLKGIKRVPIIMMQNPSKHLGELGLDKYEVSMIECMHDLAHHIENVLAELPHHLSDAHKSQFNGMLTILKVEKEKKRCCDWRKMLLVLTQNFVSKKLMGKYINC